MKLLRLCLLVLLAAMIPFRGAIAAAMLCPPAAVGTQSDMRPMERDAAPHDHAGDAPAHAAHQHADGTQHDHGTSNQDKCNLCSAFCSLTPLLSDTAGIADPGDLVDPPFPAFSAPAPSFLSDGQERPPRSI